MIDTDSKYKRKQSTKSKTYRVAGIIAPRTIAFVHKSKPEPRKNQVLVRLEGCGLCASNIPVWEGREWFEYPMEAGTPGHEGWGIIEAAGPEVVEVKPGQRVALLDNHAFAEYVLTTENNLVAIPGSLRGIPFPGEPFGCTMNIKKRSDILAGQTVAIIGMGFIGLSLVPLIRKAGAKVIALSRRQWSLDKAMEFGADEVIRMDDHQRVLDKVRSLTGNEGCERVIECTGKQWPLDVAGELASYGGKVIIAGYHQDGLRKINMQLWNWKGLDVINAHERDHEQYKGGIREAIIAVENGLLSPTDFLTHSFPMDELSAALDFVRECPEGLIKAYIKY